MNKKVKNQLVDISIQILVECTPTIVRGSKKAIEEIIKYASDKIDTINYDKKNKTVIIESYDDVIDVNNFVNIVDDDEVSEDDILKCIGKFNESFGSKEKISEFRGEYIFLSSYYKSKLNYKGIIFDNAEAAFQSMKSNDIEIRKSFSSLSAKQAKAKGRAISLRNDWENIKEEVMYNVCMCKFNQNPELATKLINTGNAYLEQGSLRGDTEWGTVNGVGSNKLGQILMKVRDEIKKDI